MVHKNYKLKILISLLLAVCIFLLIYIFFTQKYYKCIKYPLICLTSQKYQSPSNIYNFRYPRYYPTSFSYQNKTDEKADRIEYQEWVNFSYELNNDSDQVSLGGVKLVDYPDVPINALVKSKYSTLAFPAIYKNITIDGKDAICASIPTQDNNSFASTECYISHKKKMLIITLRDNNNFKINPYYVIAGREIILSTFSLN